MSPAETPANRSSEPRETASSNPLSEDQRVINERTVDENVENLEVLIEKAELDDCLGFQPANRDNISEIAAARLGIASGLFDAIRMKHSPTALHCLRTALGCSVWFDRLKPGIDRDALEIGALLHDLGKIGVSDEILTKPSELNVDERNMVESQRKRGLEVLESFCRSKEVIECVKYSTTWFDGSRNRLDRQELELPQASRMLAIADAFDSMTTDQVYRKALSIDRAVAELFENAGSQFDPELVKSFAKLVAKDWFDLQDSCAREWAQQKTDEVQTSSLWSIASGTSPKSTPAESAQEKLSAFQTTLFSQMLDAVIFVDRQGKILFWNPAAERITGLTSNSVLERRISPSLIELQDESGTVEIPDSDCPFQKSMALGESKFARFSLRGRTNSRHVVEVQIAPVIGQSGEALGATIILHDSSRTCSLEERVESLFSRAAQDPLTKVANRAEFDRVHAEFVEQHLQEKTPCAMILCDIDYFKAVNDEYGHQAGDEALVAFAALLKRFHRVGDLVARYGGEEFVLLCAGSDNQTATERAEEIRQVLQNTPLEALNRKSLTASFGVTEIQQGDTPELMLRRADRALFMAKEEGRNRVIQLGAGMDESFEPEEKKSTGSFLDWFRKKTVPAAEQPVQKASLVSQVPLELAIEKLKGFVTDQDAQIIDVEGHDISIKVNSSNPNFSKRNSDRPVPFSILLQFSSFEDESQKKKTTRTRIRVLVTPIRTRDRRVADLAERSNLIINSVKSYLMASCEDELNNPTGHVKRAVTQPGR